MKTIGQFAKENDITVKTLHHYEKLGLITPIKIDDSNGYRYYSEEQSVDLQLILYLKQLGLSLSEIKKVLNAEFDNDSLIEFLELKIRQTVKDKINAENRHHKLINIVNILQSHNDNMDYKEMLSMSERETFSGKYGRETFVEEAENMFNIAKHNGTKLCVVDLDLDHFAAVNNDFGYEVGDVVIDRTQSEILAALQETNLRSMFERSGGDEFHIVIAAGIMETTKLITSILNRVVAIDYSDVAEDLRVGISAGIASIRKDSVSYAELISKAATELYKNKVNKRK